MVRKLPPEYPRHLALIMDGNGRWAQQRHLSRLHGHRAGVRALRQVLSACLEHKMQVVTLFAFGQDNWKRPEAEIEGLFDLMSLFLRQELASLSENHVRIQFVGCSDPLPETLKRLQRQAEQATKNNTGMLINVALNYSGRWDIVNACRQVCEAVAVGELERTEIHEETLSRYMALGSDPGPDLLIRTSGEIRLSNFLLWQLSYTELFFSPVLWPDFTSEHLNEAFEEYARRRRRFGMTDQQLTESHDA